MELDELWADISLRREGKYPKVLHRCEGPTFQLRGGSSSHGPRAVNSAAPAFPYTEGDIRSGNPAAVYWGWFQLAMGRRLSETADAKGRALKEPTAAGVSRVCSQVLGKPLSETKERHLQEVPVSAAWLQQAMKL
eukprot:TRINITY_DN22710_c0_g1_i1.p2 TRINITY_DN22710_c0_g1~~TRINITY_DN22710_c0_g1_i1.p2  ORF type:complete len:135 (+),score=24.73 TRINITY_DN22710_c0_g1_i1:72-476(+)